MALIKNINSEDNTHLNKNMILSMVTLATKEIQGVVDVYQSTKLSFTRLFDKNIGKGVRIRETLNGVIIDVYVIVSTEVEVNDIVYRIQQNVKNSLTSLIPIKIKAINIHIKDAEKTSL